MRKIKPSQILAFVALLALAEAAKVERVVLAARIDVVGKQIVMSNQMAFVSMIPEIADILDQLTVVINQRVVNGDDAILTVARGRVVLKPFEALVIQTVWLPRRLGQEAVEA